ncbi:serine/threonine kinase [Fragilaria crotonensis]|nr:serine/threonine kinase [Fragilaria crotonensis]
MTLDQELIKNARDGYLDKVRDLLQRGANVNAKDEDGWTALIWASTGGRLELVRVLLNHDGVDVNAKDRWGDTALYRASWYGFVEVVRALLNHNGVDVNIKDNVGDTALIKASESFHSEVVRVILNHDGVDVNIQNNDGNTALILASKKGHLEVVRALLNHDGVDVNIKGQYGNPAVIHASINGHLEVVRALLMHNGVDVNIQNNHGFTALILASNNGHTEVVRALLVHNGVDVNAKDEDGFTALIRASFSGKMEVVLALLNHDEVDVNMKNNWGTTALIDATYLGHLEVVRALLKHNGVDVNIKNDHGATALIQAIHRGHVEVVRALLNHVGVDVNMKDNDGNAALDNARKYNNDDIVRLLEKHEEEERNRLEEEERRRREEEERSRRKDYERRQAMEEKRRRQELLNRRPAAASVAGQRVTGNPPRRNENSPSNDDAAIEKDRSKLFKVMSSTSKDHDPVELSHQYIEHCITNRTLGSGAFGDVFLAEDSHLPKKFAVKKVKLAQCDQDTINEIRKSFQRELSFLVYEYAANGSLDGFLRDDGNRARLTADIRLSIMFEVARAVNFLHSGGCEGWKVFHRDIKSANICLAEDFTARLIDCGLAKFVPDENPNIVPGSVIPSVRSTTGGPAFGTPGYMCPEYVKKKSRGRSCPYIAAFDVYSIGIVMVELILGCLIGGQSTRNGTQFDDVFEKYVKDEDDDLIVDGWKILERDADPSIIWDPRSLRLVCKTAIRCITPSSKTRLSTSELLEELRTAITETPNPETNSAGDNRPFCIICNQYRTDMACSEGHPLCSGCIGNALGHSTGYHVSCLIDRCSSQPFETKIFLDAYLLRRTIGTLRRKSNMPSWTKFSTG